MEEGRICAKSLVGVGGKSRVGFCEIGSARSGEECSRAQWGAIMRAESSR